MRTERLDIAPEVADALAGGRPVVALESTLISHGLPYPQNVVVARASEAAVRESGSVPATIAIHSGRLRVGLRAAELEALGAAPAGSVLKAARPNLAAALAGGGWAATTVSATMIVAHAAGIRVFATGGIGGVHHGALGGRGGASTSGGAGTGGGASTGDGASTGGGAGASSVPTFDISSDLEELGRTPVAVVCAGPKAINDLRLTLEYLETRGVPVVTIGQREVPGFYARSSGVESPSSVADEAAAANLIATHLEIGLGSGILVCVPAPAEAALSEGAARAAVERAVVEAEAAGIAGPALTPWLLARIGVLTGGASVRANTALIENDARVAGRLSAALATLAAVPVSRG